MINKLAGSRDDGSAPTRPHGGGGSTTLHLNSEHHSATDRGTGIMPFLRTLLAAFHERTGTPVLRAG